MLKQLRNNKCGLDGLFKRKRLISGIGEALPVGSVELEHQVYLLLTWRFEHMCDGRKCRFKQHRLVKLNTDLTEAHRQMYKWRLDFNTY